MILSDLVRRIRIWLRDATEDSFDFTDEIQPKVDDIIEENFITIVKVMPRFYFKSEEYTGIVDAEDEDNEKYAFPDDFGAFANVRRSDLIDKPKLGFVGDGTDQEKYRHTALYPFYDPDPNVPVINGETVAFYDADYWRILPAPQSSSYTYEFNYYRSHTEAVQEGDEVDIPRAACPYVAACVAADLLLIANEATAQAVISRMLQIKASFETRNEKPSAGVLPEVARFW